MEKLIQEFTIKSLSDFFKKSVPAFKNDIEDLNHYIGDKNFISFSELTRIGNLEFKNSDELIVFACKYNGKLSEKSSKKKQFEIAKLVLKEDFKDGAIFVFYDESGKFRFSFIRRNWDGKGDKKYSSWKRFTYFVDPRDHNKTFRQRVGNCTFKDLDSIQDAFSVEKLTKEFYNDLFKWYQWTLKPEVGITFPNNTSTSDDDRVQLEEQMIRLITRLLFVWFIKQKHLVPDELFKSEKLSEILKDFDKNSVSSGSYYNAILQNLFFATLNKSVIEREFAKLAEKRDIKTRYRYAEMFNISEKDILNLFCPIPFLNGGLFECLDKEESTDGVKYHLDGFSRSDKKSANGNFKHRAFIPNSIFFGDGENEGLIPLLERYNFTVEENVPNEVQVALDPELLGNVFENLLGAFNPETQESARKQSGSFYTPKEIVAYMVDESLIAFLKNGLPDLDQKLIQQLFEQDDLPESLQQDHKLCETIEAKLKSVKILDPACGSGAFPMGILNRMVNVLDKLDAKNKASHHDLKLHLIEECIYGIDIQTIAAQISKLRFFISLIVEQEEMDLSKPEENYGVLTLPNLETKFVAANTLVGMQKKKEGDFVNSLFTDPLIDITKQELMNVRKEHFYAKSAYKKKELRDNDALLRGKLSKLLQDNNEFAPEDAVQFSQWNPYDQNASSPFFDPEWMFGLSKENGGLNTTDGGYFDIVIGNPPYVDSETMIRAGQEDFRRYLKENYSYAEGNWDLFIVFIELAKKLTLNKGIFSYIIPNKLISTKYGISARNDLKKNLIVEIRDYSRLNVFTSADVYPVTFVIQKNLHKNDFSPKFTIMEDMKNPKFTNSIKDLNLIDDKSWDICFYNSQVLNLLMKLKDNKVLGNFDCKILGAATVNEAYLIKDKMQDSSFLPATFKFINTGTIDPFKSLWGIKKTQYIKGQYNYPVIEKKDLKLINETRFKQSSTPKIIIAGMSSSIEAFLDISGEYLAGKSTSIIIDNDENLRLFLAILNSKVVSFYINQIYNSLKMAGGYLNISPDIIKSIPIPNAYENIILKDKIKLLIEKGNPLLQEEINDLDNIIYKLYNLNYEEVKIIDSNYSLSPTDYEGIRI